MCPNYHVIKATQVERYLSNDKILIQEYLVEVDLHALMDKAASRIIMAKKCHTYFCGQYFVTVRSPFKMGLRWKHRTQRIEATVVRR